MAGGAGGRAVTAGKTRAGGGGASLPSEVFMRCQVKHSVGVGVCGCGGVCFAVLLGLGSA